MKVYLIEIEAPYLNEIHTSNVFLKKEDAKHVLTFFADERTPIFVDPMYVMFGNKWYDELKDEFEMLNNDDKLTKFKNVVTNFNGKWNYENPPYSDATILGLLHLSFDFNYLKGESVIFEIIEKEIY